MPYELSINGNRRTVDVPADTPLLWILRDELELTGTKYGCGIGMCGACTVLRDGEPIRSCQLAIADLGADEITTIEGLSESGTTAVQRAWIEEDVPQCGYCQAGQVMTATALLARTPNPTEREIEQAMSPILCRCGTYTRIRRAVHRAADLNREG